MSRIALLLALLACLLPLQGVGAEAPADERSTLYREYRALFDAGNYTQALPLAVRVVELTANQFGAEEPELANPLTNLATTLYRMEQYGDALDTYRRALNVLELTGNSTDARLIAPLHGLGASLRGLGRHEDAIVPLKRAVDIIRNRDGLHAPAQLPMLRLLISSYEQTRRNEDATREHMYAFNVAEQAWGGDDPRMIPVIAELAQWHEKTGRYTAARLLHIRTVQIADRERPMSVKAVDGLRGIARTYRLAFTNGESQDDAMDATSAIPPSLGQSGLVMMSGAPSADGERALRSALQRLDLAAAGGGTGASPGTNTNAQRGAVLLDLGDWYRIAGVGNRAMASWRDAWQALHTAGDTSAMEQPSPIIYRAPQIAVSERQQDPDEFSMQEVELRVSIAADGDVRDVTVANPAAERESAERAVAAAVRRGTWRPAFAAGVPVAATSFTFREQVYVRLPDIEVEDEG
jgi:tetratricopeptide (TPR) repeat protein